MAVIILFLNNISAAFYYWAICDTSISVSKTISSSTIPTAKLLCKNSINGSVNNFTQFSYNYIALIIPITSNFKSSSFPYVTNNFIKCLMNPFEPV